MANQAVARTAKRAVARMANHGVARMASKLPRRWRIEQLRGTADEAIARIVIRPCASDEDGQSS